MTTEQSLDFSNYCERMRPRIIGYLTNLGVPIDDRDDIAQETLLRALQHWPVIDGWSYSVARNLYVSGWRHNTRHPESSLTGDEVVEHPFDAGASVTDRMVLGPALRTLSPHLAETVRLVAILGYTPVQAGPMLGVEPQTVRKRFASAARQLYKAGVLD